MTAETPSLTIDFLDAAHGEQAASLLMQAFQQSAQDARDVVGKMLDGNRTRDRVVALGALAGGKLVGMISCRKPPGENLNDTYGIVNLAVDRESRGLGIGRTLLKAGEDFIAREWLKGEFGFARLWDFTKRGNPASHFYEDAGYAPGEDPDNLPEVADPMLVKPLNEDAFDTCGP